MDFEISEKTLAAAARVREVVERDLAPLEPALAAGEFARVMAAIDEKRRRARELGLWAPHLPAALGGMGLELLDFAALGEEMGRSPLGHLAFNCQAPDAGNMELLLAHGSPEQKSRWLEPLARGDIRSCFAMTEPGFPGSNPTWMAARARRDGGDYVIDGEKWFASSADGAAFAVVMAVSDPEAAPRARASMVIVPAGTPGFEIERNIPVMGESGAGPFSHAQIRFRGCRVPASNRIGAEGSGYELAQERLGPGRIHHCMRWIGICERALDLLCRRAAARRLAPGKLLGTQGVIQEWIAESRAEIDAARLLVMRSAWSIGRSGARAERAGISMIKFHTAGVLQRVLDRAIQAHGALGLTDATPLEWWWRHERGARIYDGPDEVHKASVGRRILRGYGVERAAGE